MFITLMVRRISSILDGSKLAGNGGYCGKPNALKRGSRVLIDWVPLTFSIWKDLVSFKTKTTISQYHTWLTTPLLLLFCEWPSFANLRASASSGILPTIGLPYNYFFIMMFHFTYHLQWAWRKWRDRWKQYWWDVVPRKRSSAPSISRSKHETFVVRDH